MNAWLYKLIGKLEIEQIIFTFLKFVTCVISLIFGSDINLLSFFFLYFQKMQTREIVMKKKKRKRKKKERRNKIQFCDA